MAVTHTNRHEKTFYLHEGTTTTGKPKFFFSLRKEGNLALAIPAEFEVHENADARVSIRRIPPKIIDDQELEVIKDVMKKESGVQHYWIEVKANSIIISTADEEEGGIDEWAACYPPYIIRQIPREKLERMYRSKLIFMAMMMFELVDAETRRFITKRYCFSGSIDRWITIGSSGSLQDNVQEFVKHLGNESFYELF